MWLDKGEVKMKLEAETGGLACGHLQYKGGLSDSDFKKSHSSPVIGVIFTISKCEQDKYDLPYDNFKISGPRRVEDLTHKNEDTEYCNGNMHIEKQKNENLL
jgi:hypothetical protein